MAKSEPKTMRFDSEVEAYINKFDGKSFTERFDTMVNLFMVLEDEKKKRIEFLDKEIKSREKRLKDLDNMLFDVRYLENAFGSLKRAIDGAQGYLDNFLKKDIEKSVIRNSSEAPDRSREGVLQRQNVTMPGQLTV